MKRIPGIRKNIFLYLGHFFLVLGIIGLVLPVIPTSPFLIVAGVLYLNSSRRLFRRLLNDKYLGGYIKPYFSGEGYSLTYKILVVVFIVTVTGITVIYISPFLLLNLFTITVSLLIILFVIFKVPTKKSK